LKDQDIIFIIVETYRYEYADSGSGIWSGLAGVACAPNVRGTG